MPMSTSQQRSMRSLPYVTTIIPCSPGHFTSASPFTAALAQLLAGCCSPPIAMPAPAPLLCGGTGSTLSPGGTSGCSCSAALLAAHSFTAASACACTPSSLHPSHGPSTQGTRVPPTPSRSTSKPSAPARDTNRVRSPAHVSNAGGVPSALMARPVSLQVPHAPPQPSQGALISLRY